MILLMLTSPMYQSLVLHKTNFKVHYATNIGTAIIPGKLKDIAHNARWSWIYTPYLLLKQHNRPDLPKNQQQPINRMRDKPAVAHSSARKNSWVRPLAPPYQRDVSKSLHVQENIPRRLTDNPNLSKLSLVMTTASKAFEKIHDETSFVLKLLYESSNVFFSTTTGST